MSPYVSVMSPLSADRTQPTFAAKPGDDMMLVAMSRSSRSRRRLDAILNGTPINVLED